MYSEQASTSSMDVDLKALSSKASRPKPYLKPQPRLPYTRSDPDAANRWGHDLFGASVPGGNLAHRLSASQKIAIRDGKGSASSSSSLNLGGKDLLDDDLDLRGNGANRPRAAATAGGGRASLAARVGGATPAATNGGARSSPAATGPGLSIKGKSNKTIVEVSNLDVGTTAEDVKATFESFGNIISSRLGPRQSSSVTVILEFSLPTAAQASITAFDGQIADGRTISVKFKAPSPSASPAPTPPTGPAASRVPPPAKRAPAAAATSGSSLLTRLGLPSAVKAGGAAPRREVARGGDLMDGLSGSSGMYSDAIQNPRASVQTVPGRSASGSAGRGRGRGGRGRGGVRGVGGMQVD